VRRKDQTNLESKMRIMRFIAEMAKFGICPKQTALSNLQVCSSSANLLRVVSCSAKGIDSRRA
jgi:hypothetical protein